MELFAIARYLAINNTLDDNIDQNILFIFS